MTPEEKQAMVQFMGTIYGESKKNDDMLVGQSTNLQPKSNQVRQRVEEVLRTPSSSTPLPRAVEAPPLAAKAPIQSPDQAAAELAQLGASKTLVPNADRSVLEEVVTPDLSLLLLPPFPEDAVAGVEGPLATEGAELDGGAAALRALPGATR